MNVLLMGGGWIAEMVYVPFLSALRKVSTIYIIDLEPEATKQRFAEYNKVTVVTISEMKNLDIALICILTPNYLHYENLINFLGSPAIILVEKPICCGVTQVAALKAAYKSDKHRIYVSAPFRYRADLQKVKQIIDCGDLGNIYHVEISWLKRRGTPGSAWFTQKKYSGGGVLMDMGPHLLDLFYWIFGARSAEKYLGTVSSKFLNSGDAYADWHRAKDSVSASDVEDASFAHLSYADISLSLNTSWASNIENDYAQLKIFGDKLSMNVLTSIGFSTNTLYKETHISMSSGQQTDVTKLQIEDRKQPFRKMLTNLIDDEEIDLPTADQALHVMHDIFNIYEHSAQIKNP